MKVLFICNQNLHRSRTAEELFSNDFDTGSAGLYNEKPVTSKQIEWADLVAVMEESQISELARRFPGQYLKKRVINLDIPDIYSKDQPELVELLKSRFTNSLT